MQEILEQLEGFNNPAARAKAEGGIEIFQVQRTWVLCRGSVKGID